MIWVFHRRDEILRVETRLEPATAQYTLEIHWPLRPPRVEQFRDVAAFQERLGALERELEADDWVQSGNPTIVLRDWRGPTEH